MAKIYIAANFVTASESSAVPNDVEDSGHLQFVYEDDDRNLIEVEVQAPDDFGLTGGDWVFLQRDHTEADDTDDYIDENGLPTDPNRYSRVELAPREGQTVEQFWDLIVSIHNSLATNGANLDYDYNLLLGEGDAQNSNTYAVTMLYALGLDPNELLPLLMMNANGDPNDIAQFAGATGNVLLFGDNGNTDFETGVMLDVVATTGNDYLRSGNNNDTITGNDGADILYGGGGDDFLFAGEQHGAEFTGEDLIFDPEFANVDYPYLSAANYADGEVDYLFGGAGNDRYFVAGQGVITENDLDESRTIGSNPFSDPNGFNKNVYDHIDIINDSDGNGQIWFGLDGLEDFGDSLLELQ